MKIIIAPQSFKGCASAEVIASTIAAGVHRAFPTAELVLAPIADGGDGTLDILLAAKSGQRNLAQVSGPLYETKLVYWGALLNAFPKTAILEMSKVCGLASLKKNLRNPLLTSSYGLGELINIALKQGFKRLFIGLGGSATNDAGVGMAQALGVKFLDRSGKEIPRGGGALASLTAIDTTQLNPLIHQAEFIVGCDVNNPLLGPSGASLIYSPQKGASKESTLELEMGMQNFSRIVKQDLHTDLEAIPYLGAAGGTAASLFLFCHAKLVAGAEWILDQINFDQMLENADLVITGEGCIDSQTASNKAPIVVAAAAKKRRKRVIAIVGMVGQGVEALDGKGIDAIYASCLQSQEIPDKALPLLQAAAEKAVMDFMKNG